MLWRLAALTLIRRDIVLWLTAGAAGPHRGSAAF